MPYKGMWPLEVGPNEEFFKANPPPVVKSWQVIEHPYQSFVWQVKPPGTWGIFMRIDQNLIVNNLDIPIETVDYEGIWEMLGEHGSGLLCRISPEIGVIGIAAHRPKVAFTPLLPGFKSSSTLVLPPTAHAAAEASADYPWPEGLEKPSIIGVEAASSLIQPDSRKEWLKRCPEGIWLVNSAFGVFQVYEVMN